MSEQDFQDERMDTIEMVACGLLFTPSAKNRSEERESGQWPVKNMKLGG